MPSWGIRLIVRVGLEAEHTFKQRRQRRQGKNVVNMSKNGLTEEAVVLEKDLNVDVCENV